MERLQYERRRWSLKVSVEPTASGGARLRLGPHPGLGTHAVGLTAATLAAWAAESSEYVPGAFRAGGLRSFLRRWLALAWPVDPPFTIGSHRLELRVEGRRLAQLPWERAFRAAGVQATVRISPTPPMAADLPLSFPLRFLQVNPTRSRLNAKRAIGEHRWVGPAVVVGQCSLRKVGEWSSKPDWPTADVLHFAAQLPASDEPRLLSTAHPDDHLTLGGLGRLTSLWQTRLVILECADASQTRSGLLLGSALADRGGPAVLVVGPGAATELRDVLRKVYFDIIHDQPLDLPSTTAWEVMSLIAGAGREELLRPSNIVTDIGHMNDSLASAKKWSVVTTPGPKGSSTVVITAPGAGARSVAVPSHWSPYRAAHPIAIPGLTLQTAGMPRGSGKGVHRAGVAAVRKALRESVLSKADGFEFSFSEREGTGPAAAGVGEIRKRLELPPLARPAPRAVGPRKPPLSGKKKAKKTKSRKEQWESKYVNPLIARPERDGLQAEMKPDGKPLEVGELYYLFVDIGRQREDVRVMDATALQEVHLRSGGEKGVWVELGVTGLDFEVDGPPVRELWVPSDDRVSQAMAFAVTPRKAGVARLRYSVFIRQNLVHSYVLAARTTDGTHGPGRAADLAAALGTPKRKVGRAAWLARLEYSLSGRLVDRPARALSIVTNHVRKESTITVKGADTFGVRKAGDLTDLTAEIRQRLGEISAPTREEIKDKRQWPYAFGSSKDLNEGKPQDLERHLMSLAEVGWELYDKVMPEDERPGVAANLAQDDRIIQVASILLDEIIPWSIVYDQPYDANREADGQGNTVEHAGCLAGLPSMDGNLPAEPCGKNPKCVLHPAQLAKRAAAGLEALLPETVACPRHFWGFRHLIELPPQQTESTQKATEQALKVENRGRPKMAVGINGGLSHHDRHIRQLGTDLGGKVEIAAPAYRRDRVIRALDRNDLDIVYLYCHAEGGAGSGLRVPVLKFRDPADSKDGVIKAAQLLGASWSHRPLVIVNGCESGAFRPDALSPFIEKLITDRSGGAFIGTEITVFEALATRVAEWVLTDFVAGSSIGAALSRTRRRLLAIHNPLGLVYTLYGATELALARPG